MCSRIFIVLILLVCCVPKLAQAQSWQSIHSPHFRVHYLPQYHAWASAAAIELEAVRQRVLEEQNRALDVVVDAIVIDPYNLPNGFALPSSDSPFMALYTTPPQSDTAIAHSPSWLKLLVLHEYIHLVHLSQPSRHGLKQRLRDFSDSYDLASAVLPRWVAEGYATLQESKLTGKGRLYDNYSEALLREYARQGALLPYHALSDGDGSYRASAMAYLLGARFLAWLEHEYGEATLDAVWTRVNAVEGRDFDIAFQGAFGKPAMQLYRRFIAQYTYQAMAAAPQSTPAVSQEVMQFGFAARDMQFSPEQRKFLVVESSQAGKVTLTVYKSEINHQAISQFEQRQAAIIKADPSDIPDKRPDSFVHEKLASLASVNFSGIYHPQWRDEDTIYFVGRQKVPYGWENALFEWQVEADEVKSVSNSFGIRRYALLDDLTVIAERVEHGYSQLIQFSLQDQHMTPLSSRTLSTVYDYPVISPNGSQLAYLKTNQAGLWRLYVAELEALNASHMAIPLPDKAQYVTSPRWNKEGTGLYFIAGVQGALGIYHYDLKREQLAQLSLSGHVVEELAGEFNAQLWFVESTPYGSKLSALPDIDVLKTQQMTLKKPHSVVATQFKNTEPTPALSSPWLAQQYVSTPQDWSLAFSVQGASASTQVVSFAIAGADVLKQKSWQVGVSTSLFDDVLQGGYFDFAYRRGDMTLRNQFKLHTFDATAQSVVSEVQGEHDLWSNTVDMSLAFQWQKWRWRPYVGNYIEHRQYQDTAYSYWLGNTVSFHHNQQPFALNLALDGAKVWGDNTGHEMTLNTAATLWDWPFYLNVTNRYRPHHTFSIGGFATNSLYTDVGASQQHIADLPFWFDSGNHYLGYEFATSWREGRPRLYFAQHNLDSERAVKSWGVKWQVALSQRVLGSAAKYAPAGISNMRFDIGISRLSAEQHHTEWRAWLGLWHPW
ncbi:TolB family protein [Pseudoalteromonas luteoviolacea]|uniref:Peptidase MA-like domain-containing protein n=1 Tax=Pseudoalteromonas luteoviolacea S4054 TaxID=1129367 RepID=A0A0F6AH72_9GAMM|nr:hypothetical protein [Pseudoalteromonas luteoviolacea]AOT06437.1 hypothetical protein S4054249_00370 [Pseudoalteromonas luteoviolacea]AOT11354.1 hypothetical protein S40542_00370 [Pseudoalteromonas luteoviolacea]AOT16267.1 hypothetical protein S4054_00370 [Pseudoalteromonas luteoviolacea]KKE85557.1 hypothetical protein N479_04465 [Pseudoalteromonas luteoviolacea S4054]KZN73037.1 hypothetical protein N481_13365 [Pseudoalteromonas luteoviolacea S4047-1]